ncbi:MAG: hypothetical protein SFU86_21825 [Pirellulaceae bacterium]|nr:hypothetical protein [Pirellulaceae bacterium]
MIRFTIRDVLWLTVVVAVLSAWGVNHRRQAALIDWYQAEIERNVFWKPAGGGVKSVSKAAQPAAKSN